MTPHFQTCGEGRLIQTYRRLLWGQGPRGNENGPKDVSRNKSFALCGGSEAAISVEPLSPEDIVSARDRANPFHTNASLTAARQTTSNDGGRADRSSAGSSDEETDALPQYDDLFEDAFPLQPAVPPRHIYEETGITLGEIDHDGRRRKQARETVADPSEESSNSHGDESHLQHEHADRTNPPDDRQSLEVRVEPYTQQNGWIPRIEFCIKMIWIADGKKHEKHSMFGFHADNIATLFPAQPVASRGDLRGRFWGPLGDLVDRDLSTNTAEFGIQYSGESLYAYNLDKHVDFGPFTEQIHELKDRLEQGCKIFYVVQGIGDQDDINKAQRHIIRAKKQSLNPYARWWRNGQTGHFDVFEYKLPADRPNTAVGAHINYLNLQEYEAAETFGFLREFELTASLKRTQAKCYLFRGSENNGPELIALIKDELEEYDLEPGDIVSVRIHQPQESEINNVSWSGQVKKPLPLRRFPCHVVLRLHSPHDAKENADFRPNLSRVKGVPTYTNPETEFEAQQLIGSASTFTIDISASEDVVQNRRRMETMQNLHKIIEWEKRATGVSLTEDFILANNFERLPIVNLFEGAEEFVDDARNHLHPDQLDAFDSLHEQVGGTSLIVGPPGSGKTEILLHAVATHLQSTIYKHPQVLLVSPMNGSVDEITGRLHRLPYFNRAPRGRAIVIRLLAPRTEQALFHFLVGEKLRSAGGHQRTQDRVKRHEQSSAESLTATSAADSRHQKYMNRFLVDDPRTNLRNCGSSLAYHALVAAGILGDGFPHLHAQALSEGNEFGRIEEIYRKGQNEDLAYEDRKTLKQLTGELFKWMLERADVVCATIERAADPLIFNTLRPSMIGADDMARAHSAEIRGLVANYPGCHRRVWVGDPYQSRPFTSSSPTWNAFASQFALSEFTRLLLAGFPVAVLTKQHRSCAFISSIISRIFYDDEIIHGSPKQNQEVARKLANFMTALKLESASTVDGASEQQIPGSTSKINPISAAVCWRFVEKLMQRYDIDAESLLVLTPYNDQKVLHDHARAKLNAATAKADDLRSPHPQGRFLQNVRVETIDKVQGTECDIVILDITSSKEVGFIGDAERILTGLSRAKHGIIIVANLKTLALDGNGFGKKRLNQIICAAGNYDKRKTVSECGENLDEIKARYLPLFPKY